MTNVNHDDLSCFEEQSKCVQLTKHCKRVIMPASFQVEVIRMCRWICANSCSLSVVNNKYANQKKSIDCFMMYALSVTEPISFMFDLSQTMKWNDLMISWPTQATFFILSPFLHEYYYRFCKSVRAGNIRCVNENNICWTRETEIVLAEKFQKI